MLYQALPTFFFFFFFRNTRVSCSSRLLEGIDFIHWRDVQEKNPWVQAPESNPWVSSRPSYDSSGSTIPHYKPTASSYLAGASTFSPVPPKSKPNIQIEVSYSPQVAYNPLESESTQINVTSSYKPLEDLFIQQISTKKPLVDRYDASISSTQKPATSTYTAVEYSSHSTPDHYYSSSRPSLDPVSSTYASISSYIPNKDSGPVVSSSSYTSVNTISSTYSPQKHHSSHKDSYSPHKDSYHSGTVITSHIEIKNQPELDPYLLENVQFLAHAIATNKSAHIIQTDNRIHGYH